MNNETKTSRFRLGSKVASVFMSAAILATTFTGLGATLATSGSLEVAAANSYGLADTIDNGNILHCFCWKYDDIKAMLPEIAEAGFTSIQVSPPQATAGTGAWWWFYQPLGFYIGSNAMGNKDSLTSLCSAAHGYGIKIIADVVANHLAGDHSNIQDDLKGSEYWHSEDYNADDGDRYRVTHGKIGMPDLNTEHSHVQECVINYLNELKSVGVDGIRFDAAKHIGLPSEGDQFWKNVMSNTTLWAYGEILNNPGISIDEGAPTRQQGINVMKEYASYIGVTDSVYGKLLRDSLSDKGAFPDTPNVFAGAWMGIPNNRLVYWGESHDTWSNNDEWGSSRNLDQNLIDRCYAIAGSRNNIPALYLSRPFSKDKDSIHIGAKGSTHFTSKEVAAVNHYKNALVGQADYYTTGAGCGVVCRQGGAVVALAKGGNTDVTVPNGGNTVAPGTYTDEVSGGTWTVTETTMTGHIGESGIAVFYKGGAVGGSVSASPASGTTFDSSLTVTLSCSGVTDATYTTTDGQSGSFTSGKTITVGVSLAVGKSVTVSLSGKKEDGTTATASYTYTKVDPNAKVTVNVDNSVGNWSKVYAYVYKGAGGTGNQMAEWPGVEMTKGSKYYTLDVTGYENGYAIFSDGTNSADKRYPADREPGLSIGGSSKLFTMPNKWEALPVDDPDPDPGVPTVTVDKASGTSFTTETFDIKLSLSNATKGTYSVDGGPTKTFTSATTVTIGEGKIGDSTVTVATTATGSDGTSKSYTFTYEKKFTVKTSSSSASLSKYYSTNGTGKGTKKTITVDGDISDWDSSMIIAQGTANDDPRVYRPNSMYEVPLDLYTLYGAYDDSNLYLMWEMTNVQDIVAPGDDYPLSQGILYQTMNIPFFIAVSTGKSDTIGNKCQTSAGATLWNSGITFSNSEGVNRLIAISTNGANGPYVYTGTSAGLNATEVYGPVATATGTQKSGIQFNYGLGILSKTVYGLDGAYGTTSQTNPRTLGDMCNDSGKWVEFISKGHASATMDFHYEMAIPLSELGISSSDVASSGVGVMVIMTSGKSGMDCLPYDLSMNDQADLDDSAGSQENNSFEKSDEDNITVGFARIGAGSTPTPDPDPDPDPDPTTPLQVNFGADKSAPQLNTTALTLKGIGYGGTAPYKYQFSVDGTVVKASNTTATYTWKPGTSKTHTIKCVITDSTGATATVTKNFTSEGDPDPDPDPDPVELKNTSKVSASSVATNQAVTVTAGSTGGSGTVQYGVFYKKSTASSWTTARDYATGTSASVKFSSAGTYTLRVIAKDGAGNKVNKDFTITVTAGFTNTSKVSATTVTAGKAFTVTASSTGGTGTKTYGVYYKKSGATSWTTVRGMATGTSVSVTISAAGTYTLRVIAKDGSGASSNKDFTITVNKGLANASKISATTITVGSSVTVTGAATGATGTVQYAVYYKKSGDSAWTTGQSYKTNSSVKITPKTAGTYTVRTKVKDSTGEVNKDFTLTVKASTLTNTSKLSATTISKGSSVKVTCASTGGTGTKQYAVWYKKSGQSSWITAKKYGTTTSATVTPKYTGTYYIRVRVKDGAGTVVLKKFTLTVNAALVNTTKVSATTITKGSSVKVTCASTGGVGTKQYGVWYKKFGQSSWMTAKKYGTTTSATVTPKYTGTYYIRARVKDGAGTIVLKKFTITVNAALANTSKVSASTIAKGSSVKVTCASTGGVGTKQYGVWYKKSGQSSWMTAKKYSTTTSATVTPKYTGTYYIRVRVKDGAGTIVLKKFTLTVNAALANTTKISATTITKGTAVKLTFASTGGVGTKKYAAWYKRSSVSSWVQAQDYSTTTSVSFKPNYAEKYNVSVKVKDAAGNIVKKTFTLTVNAAALTNTSKLSATSIDKGQTVKVTCASTGGTGTKQYAVWYKRSSVSTWTQVQDYSTNTSVSFKPNYAEKYDVSVKVKDGSGKIVKKALTLTVNKVLTASAKTSASSVTLGNSVTITGSAANTTGTVQYQISYMKIGTSSWTTAKAYNTTAKATIKFASKGDYSVRVNVKDGSGKVATAYVAVTVK